MDATPVEATGHVYPPPDLPMPVVNDALVTQWARVRGRLLQDVGEVEYRTWLRHMALVGMDGDEVTVSLPSRFLRDWVRGHYADKLNGLWRAENADIRRVDLRISGTVPEPEAAADLPEPAQARPKPT